MAENIQTTLQFQADISDFKAAMQEANRAIKLANSEFKAASSGMDDWSSSTDGLTAKLQQLANVRDAEKRKLEVLKTAYAQVVAEQGENSAAAVRLQTQINNQQAAVNNAEREFERYTERLEEVEDGADDAGDAAEEAGEAAERGAEGWSVMRAAIADLVADAIGNAIDGLKELAKNIVTLGIDFSSTMSDVQAISGATGEELELLEATAREWGSKTVFSATEAAEAMKYMAMAGWTVDQSVAGLPGILNLAAASGADLAEASDIVTDALTGMGYKAEDAGRLADVMAAASSNANTNVEMMGGTFKYAAPLIGALGYSMEDAAVSIGLMANAGIKAEQAGTSLRSILTRLAAPPKEAANAMDTLGISITNSDGTMKEMHEVVDDLRAAFSGLSEAEQAEMAKNIAGQEAMSALLAIVNAAPEDYKKLTEAVENSAGAAQRMSDVMNDNLGGDIAEMESALEELGLKIYEQLEGPLRSVVQWITENLNPAFNWIVENKDTILAAISGIVAGFVAFKTAAAVGALISGFIQFFTIIKSGQGVMAALNAVMNLNPISLIAAAIAGLVAAFVVLWNKSEAFRNFWINLWEGIKKAFSAVLEWFRNAAATLGKFFSDAWSFIKKAFEPFVGYFKQAWETVKGIFSVVKNVLSGNFSGAWEAIKNIFSGWGEYFSGLWDKVKGVFSAVGSWFSDIFSKAWQGIKNAWSGVKDWFGNVREGIGKKFSDIDGWMGKKFGGAWTAIKKAFEPFVGYFKQAWETVKGIFSVVKNVLSGNFSGAWEAIKKIFSGWGNFFSGLWDKVKGVFSAVGSWFGNIFSKAWSGITNAFSNVGSFFSGIWDKIKSVFSIDGMLSIGKNLVQGLWNGISNSFQWIKDKISGWVGNVMSFIKRLFGINSPSRTMRDEVGKMLGLGMAEGIEDSRNAVNSAVRKLGDAALGGLSPVGGGVPGAAAAGRSISFTQINNSPRALSRREIYRQTHNVLAFAGGVSKCLR